MWRAACCVLASGAAATGLALAAWPGAPGDPATLINRLDVVATAMLLAGLPFLVRRRYGPARRSWAARLVRIGGYALVCSLMLVKADVERVELARRSGAALAGVWAGEVVLLLVIAAYIAALLAMTAQRSPGSRPALTYGIGAGLVLGLAVCGLRPLVNHVHIANPWLAGTYDVARFTAVLLVPCAAIRAAIAAARRTPRRDARRPQTNARARQGMATGLYAGLVAGLLVTVLGLSLTALMPHVAASIRWTLPGSLVTGAAHSRAPDAVSIFEVSFSYAAAGYLLVLIVFPVLGAGLGAWGGLYAAGTSRGPGGDGGGGGGSKDPRPKPRPGGGLELDDFPEWDELKEFPELDPDHEPDRERVPELV